LYLEKYGQRAYLRMIDWMGLWAIATRFTDISGLWTDKNMIWIWKIFDPGEAAATLLLLLTLLTTYYSYKTQKKMHSMTMSKMSFLILTLLLVGGYAVPTAPYSNARPALGFHQPLPGKLPL
jgi:hypothetical protein